MTQKILVVDNEPDICRAIRLVLEHDEFSVICANSAEEAIEALSKDTFDAILTDLKMRGGLNGMAVLEKARQLSPQTPVIVMTAYGSYEYAIEATKHGASAYILKPFLNEDVKLTLRRSIEKNRMLLVLMKESMGLG